MIYSKESESRRSDWVEGRWIKLANGEGWSFPTIDLGTGPDGLPAMTVAGRQVDPAYDAALREAFMDLDQDLEPAGDQVSQRFVQMIYAVMLMGNYQLTETEALMLISYGFQAQGDWEGLTAANGELRSAWGELGARIRAKEEVMTAAWVRKIEEN